MIKKIFIFFIIFNILQGCGYTPIYSKYNQPKINIKKINFAGDWEFNNFLEESLSRYMSSDEPKEYEININSNYTKNSTTKSSSGDTTNYIYILDININLISDDINENFSYKESFTMENITDELDEKNYETFNKRNIASLIINKFIIRISRLK